MHPDYWQLLPPADMQAFDQLEQILHRASQFIAVAGASLLPQKADHSHTNIFWDPENEVLHGRSLRTTTATVQVVLDLPAFKLQIRRIDGQILLQQAIADKTFDELTAWLKFALAGANHNVDHLGEATDYELPDHPVHHGAVFEWPDQELLGVWMAARTNANTALEQMNTSFEHSGEVAIWPHHFDTGIYIPLAFASDNTEKPIKAIGMGWSVKDNISKAPYFYSYGWSAAGGLDFRQKPVLTYGNWHIDPDGWQGAFLNYTTLASATTAGQQAEMTQTFFRETKEAYLQMLNNQ